MNNSFAVQPQKNAPREPRTRRLWRRLATRKWQTLPGWAFEWLYWNGALHRLPFMERLYDQYLLSKPNPRFGITSPIVIYQMGKVASTSLQHSLTDLALDVPVHQVHFMNRFDVIEKRAREYRRNPQVVERLSRKGRYVREQIESRRWKQVAMISLVRAPGPHLLSAFFQQIQIHIPDFQARLQKGELTPQAVADFFVTRYESNASAEWFDIQLKEPFGIDVYATPFPKGRGYAYYERDNIRLVVMRYEDLNHCIGTVMREFLGLSDFEFKRANVGDDKAYGELYRQVRELVRLPPERVQQLHSTRYARHFYTPQELETSIAPWTR